MERMEEGYRGSQARRQRGESWGAGRGSAISSDHKQAVCVLLKGLIRLIRWKRGPRRPEREHGAQKGTYLTRASARRGLLLAFPTPTRSEGDRAVIMFACG